jgi:PAS domain S-box-containing protein
MTEDRAREAFTADRLLDALGQAVVATDADGVVRYWNRAAQRLYGWAAAEAVGRPIGELIVPGATQSFAAEIMAVLRSGGTWSGGFLVRRRDGTTFPALVTDSGVYDDSGQLIGMVGVSTDLGAAVRPMLARGSDAAVITSASGLVHYLSPAVTTMFGWRDADLAGRSALDLVHPDDVGALRARFADITNGIVGPEFRVRCKDGSWRWVEAVLTDLRSDPVVNGLVLNVRDVSERRATQDQLRELADQLQTALQSRVVIEQAKGVLADRLGVDPEEAFTWLRRYARDHNRRLHDVAHDVVAGTVALPGARPRRGPTS